MFIIKNDVLEISLTDMDSCHIHSNTQKDVKQIINCNETETIKQDEANHEVDANKTIMKVQVFLT